MYLLHRVLSREMTWSDFHLQRTTLPPRGSAGWSGLAGWWRCLRAQIYQLCDTGGGNEDMEKRLDLGLREWENSGMPLEQSSNLCEPHQPRRIEADLTFRDIHSSEGSLQGSWLSRPHTHTSQNHKWPSPHLSGPPGDQPPFHQAFLMIAVETKCVARHCAHTCTFEQQTIPIKQGFANSNAHSSWWVK